MVVCVARKTSVQQMDFQKNRIPIVCGIFLLSVLYYVFVSRGSSSSSSSSAAVDVMRADVGTRASCIFASGSVTGSLALTQSDSGLLINGIVNGLTAGQHGFHIHQVSRFQRKEYRFNNFVFFGFPFNRRAGFGSFHFRNVFDENV